MEKTNVNLEVASFAMNCVEGVIAQKNSNLNKNYKTLVKKMPAMIQKNGLIGTLVFILSKFKNSKDSAHGEVLKNVMKWNNKNEKIKDVVQMKNDNAVEYIESITNLNSQDYRLVTKEMINLFGWIKRFADGMIEGE